MQLKKTIKLILLFILIAGLSIILFAYLSPWLFTHIAQWQKSFNQLMSSYLREIKQSPFEAGLGLVFVSFFYGVFHALGPGHGKFIIAGYLSLHHTKVKTAMNLTFLSSLAQGIVAILITSIVVVLLRLSSHYFKLSQLWIERLAFILLMVLGLYWCWQSLIKIIRHRQQKRKWQQGYTVYAVSKLNNSQTNIKSAVKNPSIFHQSQSCGCGHQHMPSKGQLEQAHNWKSQLLVILTIGMRPCTGAIFILFLSYMLDLYVWGVIATLAMALGTGITLSSFALLLQYAKKLALNIGQWYLTPSIKQNVGGIGKFIAGIMLLFFATSLFYGTMQPSSGGALLLGR